MQVKCLTWGSLSKISMGNPNAGFTEGNIQTAKKIITPEGSALNYISGQCQRHGIRERLAEMGLKFLRTQTNFILVRVPGGGRVVYERMLREGVIIRAMDSWGLSDYIRVCVGLPDENRRFVETLRRVLTGL